MTGESAEPDGIDWESQAALDDDTPPVAPPDHDWLAHEAGYVDDEVEATEAELLAWGEDDLSGRTGADR